MKLDVKDVEAIARSRVNRTLGNQLNYAAVIAMAGVLVGAFITKYSTIASWVVIIAAVGYFLWFMNSVSKKQKIAVNQLLAEWRAEQK